MDSSVFVACLSLRCITVMLEPVLIALTGVYVCSEQLLVYANDECCV